MATTLNGRKANRQAIKQAIDTGQLSGGVMPEDVFNEWVERAQEASEMLDQVRVVSMPREKMQIPKIGVGERLLREQGEAEAVDEKADTQTDQVPLDAEKNSIYWELSSESVEDTIDATAETVFNQMNTQFSADVQDLGFNGDEASTDRFESLNDGWLTLAEDRGMPTVEHDDEINTSVFNNSLLTIEDKYLRRINGQTPMFVMSRSQHQAYMNEIGNERATALGDAVLTGADVTPFGYPIMAVSNFPNDRAMLTSPRNLIYGLYREVEVDVLEQSDDIHERDLLAKYAIRVRHDFQIEQSDAGVLIEGLHEPTFGDDGETAE